MPGSRGGLLRGAPGPGGSAPGGVCSRGGAWWRPLGTATVAGGTHPTAMQSCFEFILLAQGPGWHAAYLGTRAELLFARHYSFCLTLLVGGFTDWPIESSLSYFHADDSRYYPGKKGSLYLN